MSKREIAIKAKHMWLSFLSLMGSSKTKAKLLNCVSEAGENWSHVREQLQTVAPALAHGNCTVWATLCSSYFFPGVCCDCTCRNMLGLLLGPKRAAQSGAGAKLGRTWGCTHLGHGGPSSMGNPNSMGNWKQPSSFSQASKPAQDRSSELLRQLSGVIS